MRKFKSFLALALAACTLFTVSCKNEESEEAATESETMEWTMAPSYDKGIHELNYTRTSDYLVKNNQSEYSILIPENATEEIGYAAGELQELFYEATKVKLNVVKDNTAGAYSADKKVISLGDTTYAQAANVKPTAELTEYGYTIQTDNKSIFINANSDIGVTFGVYGFLELQFNFDCFSDVYYYIDKQNDAPLLDFDVRDVPDMKARREGSQYQDDDGLRRMKFVSNGDIRTGPASGGIHNAFAFLPVETYYEEHDKWYSDNVQQLCYTAHGDEAERSLMIDTVANSMIEYYENATPNQRFIAFGQMDKGVWCECDACRASYEKYGSNCPVQTKFINEVAAKVQAWMETEEGKPYARDFEIYYLIYQKSIDAPVVYDEALGEYVPVDDSVIPAEHTLPVIAPLGMAFRYDLYDKVNKEHLENLEKWKAVLKDAECGFWSYFQNYTSFWIYSDGYTNMQNMYRFMAGCNVNWFYEEGQVSYLSGGNGTIWTALRSYLCAKLSWNVNLDIDDLTKHFFDNYFDEASDELYEVFMDTRAVQMLSREEFGPSTLIFKRIDQKQYWPRELAVNSLNTIEKGLKDVLYLKKAEPEKYQQIYANIVAERIPYEYMICEFYAGEYDPDYIYELKLQTRRDVELNNIYSYSQTDKITAQDVWDRWGI